MGGRSLQRGRADLHFASEPRRQELLRRLNRAPGGTHALVAMRADLIAAMRADPSLAAVDRDVAHLLASWFNRGFLVLRRIDWSTPAIVLEKIIRYEAVHAIRDFPSLRLRIDPPDRRCYGFFHPALPDEPLIFVEIALTDVIPGAIGPLLDPDRIAVAPDKAKVAVFYSISNCQKGLAGITFGNFLIKQVVEELRRDFPRIETFVTLSPVPGFLRWLERADLSSLSVADRQMIARLGGSDWYGEVGLPERMRKLVEPLAAIYFPGGQTCRRAPCGRRRRLPSRQRARLERMNWLGDLSEKGMRDSAGLMVNYLYDLDDIEKNHEAFADTFEIAASPAIRKLLKTEAKGRVLEAAARAVSASVFFEDQSFRCRNGYSRIRPGRRDPRSGFSGLISFVLGVLVFATVASAALFGWNLDTLEGSLEQIGLMKRADFGLSTHGSAWRRCPRPSRREPRPGMLWKS